MLLRRMPRRFRRPICLLRPPGPTADANRSNGASQRWSVCWLVQGPVCSSTSTWSRAEYPDYDPFGENSPLSEANLLVREDSLRVPSPRQIWHSKKRCGPVTTRRFSVRQPAEKTPDTCATSPGVPIGDLGYPGGTPPREFGSPMARSEDPPGGDPSISLIPPKPLVVVDVAPQRNRSSMLRSAYPPGEAGRRAGWGKSASPGPPRFP
jgi:hypothetical protein